MNRDRREFKPLVLAVGSDTRLQRAIKESLGSDSYRVEEALDGNAARELFQHSLPDIVIIDIAHPASEGLAFCRTIRQLSNDKFIPLLLLTTLEDLNSIVKIDDVEGIDFIVKPVLPIVLFHRVKNILRPERFIKVLRESEASLSWAQRIAHIGNWCLDIDTQTLKCSDEVFHIFGLYPSSFGNTYEDFLNLIHPNDQGSVKATILQNSSASTPLSLECRILLPDGTERHIFCQGNTFDSHEISTQRIAGTIQDISERKSLEAQNHFLAYFDELTHLPNQQLFRDRLKQLLTVSRRHVENVAVLHVGLDGFSRVNERLGSAFGNIVLQQAALRLQSCLRQGDTASREDHATQDTHLSRSGHDEFLVALSRLPTPEITALVAQRIIEEMQKPFTINTHQFSLTTHIGISVFPNDSQDGDLLIHNARLASTLIKEGEGDAYQFFTTSIHQTITERFAIENSLRKAIVRNELELYYQAQINIARWEITGAEALIRWNHPEKGMVSPAQFIPIAEESGLIIPIGEWVIQTVLSQIKEWKFQNQPIPRIAVNLSGVQFNQPNLSTFLLETLQQTKVEAHHLELEITEGVAMKNVETTLAMLHRFRDMGIHLSLDDFGTGYSSLSYLQQFPINTLKIDRAFVKNLVPASRDAAITKTIIGMAKALSLTVLAEGVETEKQLHFLQENGCDEIQGFLFSRPLPLTSFQSFLRQQHLSVQ